MQVVVQTPRLSTPYTSELSPDLVRIGRVLAGGNIPSIAKAVLSHSGLKEQIMLKFLDIVSSESARLCQKSPENRTLFRSLSLKKLQEFEWATCIEELRSKAPFLLRFFSTIVKHNDHRNASKHGVLLFNAQAHKKVCVISTIAMVNNISMGCN